MNNSNKLTTTKTMNLFKNIVIFGYLAMLLSCSNEVCKCPDVQNIFLDYKATALITDITDGDTYKTTEQNETISIRLLNIDCFETRRTERLTEQAAAAGISEDSAYNLGHQAKQFAIDMLLNKTVTIKRDSAEQNIDTYGRLLRHVIVNDSLFSEMLKARKLAAPQ